MPVWLCGCVPVWPRGRLTGLSFIFDQVQLMDEHSVAWEANVSEWVENSARRRAAKGGRGDMSTGYLSAVNVASDGNNGATTEVTAAQVISVLHSCCIHVATCLHPFGIYGAGLAARGD